MEPKHILIFTACCLPILVANQTAESDSIESDTYTYTLDDKTCMSMLENFATASSKYTYCLILHARPIEVCQQCIINYLDVWSIYDKIKEIDSNGGRRCAAELESFDRLEIFESGMKYIKDMWAKAYCDSCFMPDPTNGRPTSVLTPMVRSMMNASEAYKNCIQLNHNDTSPKPDLETCAVCATEYDTLNNIYTSFKTETGVVEFCMDIVDLVNSTRTEWSDTIGCCKAKRTPELPFIFAATGMCVLPVLFYLLTYAFTPKKEYELIERRRPPSFSCNGACNTAVDDPEPWDIRPDQQPILITRRYSTAMQE